MAFRSRFRRRRFVGGRRRGSFRNRRRSFRRRGRGTGRIRIGTRF